MREQRHGREAEEEKLALPPRPSSVERAAEERTGRNGELSIEQIKGWVDEYRAANGGKFPSAKSGDIRNADGSWAGETWSGLDSLFREAQKGRPARGLQNSGFESLPDFLDKTYPDERKIRVEKEALSIEQIKGWVDVHRRANGGEFPSKRSGYIRNADGSPTGETWRGLDSLFREAQKGSPARGLKNSGFESLSDFLDKTYPDEREIRVEKQDLSIKQIQGWVDGYRAVNGGKFPSVVSGDIRNADGSWAGETWLGLDTLFRRSQDGSPARGLQNSGFESLSDFLDKTYPDERVEKEDLSIEQIQGWVDRYRAANGGKFPSTHSGDIRNADGSPTGETWSGLNLLFRGAQKGRPGRGLQNSGFTSLRDFLDKTYPDEREIRVEKQDLSIEQIQGWVDGYRAANGGKFPSAASGDICNAAGSPTGETWGGLDALFRRSQDGRPARGLQNSGFESLSDFLDKTYPTERAKGLRAPTARPKSGNINVLLDFLE